MKNNTSSAQKLKNTVSIGMFCALAFIVSFCFPIKVQFLTFDAKDAIITISGMFFGPVAALIMSVIVPLLEFLTFSETGFYGLIMNFISSAAFSITASLIYKYKRKMSGAALGLTVAVVFATSVMLCANFFITPIYARYVGFPLDITREIPRLFLPFNLTKTILNSSLVLLLYKPITTALRAAKLVPASTRYKQSPKNTFITVGVSILLIVTALVVYFVFLSGSIGFFENKFDCVVSILNLHR